MSPSRQSHSGHGRDENRDRAHQSDKAAADRLAAIAGQLGTVTSTSVQAITRRPLPSSRPQREWRHLPTFKELPRQGGFPGCAWGVWGEGDQLGTVNLLTDFVVARTAKEEIRTGHAVSLNWATHLPIDPYFHRKRAHHTLWGKGGKAIVERRVAVRESMRRKGYATELRHDAQNPEAAPISDDEMHINTQSGTQWDGLRHYGHISLDCFYQGIPRAAIQNTFTGKGSEEGNERVLIGKDAGADVHPGVAASSPAARLGIHNWAQHGIVGRGVLLDVWGYLWRKHGRAPYDPCSTHAITLDIIKEVARAQGVRFRQGDILLLRLGFVQRYQNSTDEERKKWASSPVPQLAGIEQGEHVNAWLWDNQCVLKYRSHRYETTLTNSFPSCSFAAVASDQPALERWPVPTDTSFLHETLLGFFGMPIGEMFDLEELCMHAQRARRWTFYFSSWPMNIYGGVASPANASATF